MSALDLFLHLTAGGCILSRLEDDRLEVRDPQHMLTDDLRRQIRQQKTALLAILVPEPLTPYYPCTVCGAVGRYDDHGIWRCRSCWPPKGAEASHE